MVINIDPNVVYGILVAIVLIILIIETPRIIKARNHHISEPHIVLPNSTSLPLEEDITTKDTEQWPRRDNPT